MQLSLCFNAVMVRYNKLARFNGCNMVSYAKSFNAIMVRYNVKVEKVDISNVMCFNAVMVRYNFKKGFIGFITAVMFQCRNGKVQLIFSKTMANCNKFSRKVSMP